MVAAGAAAPKRTVAFSATISERQEKSGQA
jgi:hypothetical protein